MLVSTTVIAGVHAIRKNLAPAVGSLTEMGTIRLGKRTDGRSPRIREFVDLAVLDDIVFGGWDIFQEDCYAAARTAGVLEPSLLDQVRQDVGRDEAMHRISAHEAGSSGTLIGYLEEPGRRDIDTRLDR